MASSIRTALRALGISRLRSALTILGIAVGVAAVVAMVAIASGAKSRVAAQLSSLGANLIGVSPGSVKSGAVRLGAGTRPRLSEDDALAIQKEIEGVIVAAPVVYGSAQFSFEGANWAGEVRGVTPGYFVAREWAAVDGREMIFDDNLRAAKVVWLGETTRRMLFGDSESIDAIVRLGRVPFRVAGVLAKKGQSLQGDDQDDILLVPLSTARQQVIGVNRARPRAIHSVFVKMSPTAPIKEAMQAITDLLRQRHKVQPGQDDTFVVRDLAEVANIQEQAAGVLSILLAAVAAVSLLVGGIGIMNIMLVSVTERTSEIGLRMAVGARSHDVIAQFLIEAGVLALLGGCVGALAGIGVSIAIALLAGWLVIISFGCLIIAVIFSVAVGIFFGIYPAKQAARLNPVEALRRQCVSRKYSGCIHV